MLIIKLFRSLFLFGDNYLAKPLRHDYHDNPDHVIYRILATRSQDSVFIKRIA
jgi:hypothetical protein